MAEFVLGRTLHLTADGKVVEESDPSGVTVLGGAGLVVSDEDVKKYKLDDSHRAVAEAEPIEPPADLKGKLPDDFPGHAALAEAGINTYAQLRKAGDVTEISGIGPATAAKIADALEE